MCVGDWNRVQPRRLLRYSSLWSSLLQTLSHMLKLPIRSGLKSNRSSQVDSRLQNNWIKWPPSFVLLAIAHALPWNVFRDFKFGVWLNRVESKIRIALWLVFLHPISSKIWRSCNVGKNCPHFFVISMCIVLYQVFNFAFVVFFLRELTQIVFQLTVMARHLLGLVGRLEDGGNLANLGFVGRETRRQYLISWSSIMRVNLRDLVELWGYILLRNDTADWFLFLQRLWVVVCFLFKKEISARE
jgi:hypothetical protein